MTDVVERLRAANPAPDCLPPPIDDVWRKVAAGGGQQLADAGSPARRAIAALRPAIGGLMMAISAVTTVAIVVLALVLLGHNRSPSTTRPNAPPAPSSTKPLLDMLRVLRRPQTKADLDLGPELSSYLGKPLSVWGSADPSLVRLAAVTRMAGELFLIPVLPPTRRAIAKFPAPLRARARELEHEGNGATLGVFGSAAGGYGGCCLTSAQIEAGDGWLTGGRGGLNYLFIVVPDGVSKVAVRPPAASRNDLPAARTSVRNNLVVFIFSRPLENPGEITWYGPSGKIIKPTGTGASGTANSYGPRLPVNQVRSIPRELAAAFAVFRRPATPSDAIPAPERASLERGPLLTRSGLNPRLSRRVGDAQNPAYIVVGNGGLGLVYGVYGFTYVSNRSAVRGELLSESFLPGYPEVVTGLVPDGVRYVTFKFVGGGSQTFAVHDNIYQARLIRNATTMSFTSPSGRISVAL